ncbi:heterokaryon incompatibility protein-domain-containing protein [Fusarium oxysporum]|nr:heterokaryon incompatibility protein-domain-containing protein [Fusarium oxysporum]
MMASKQPNDNSVTLNQPCKFCKVLEFDDSSFGRESKTSDDGIPFVDFGEVEQTKEDREVQIGARSQRARMASSFAMQNADADAPETVAKTELKFDYSRVGTLPELPGLASSSAAGCAFCEVLRHDLMAAWKSIEENGEDEEEDEIPEPEENDSDAESEGEKAGNDTGDVDDNGGGEEKEAGGEDAKDEEGPVSDEDTNKPRYEDIDTDSDAESEPDTEPDEQADDANVQAEDSNDSDQENQEEPATKRAPRNAKLIITEVTYKLREHGSDDERPQRTWLDAMYVFFTIDCEEQTTDYSIHDTIYADRADHCSSWFDIGRRPIMNDQLSKASLSRMKELIVLSEKEQPYRLVKAPYLPTRLLDLEASCTSGLRLVITKNNLTIPKLDSYQKRYAALSYCWGSDSATTQLTTTRETLDERLSTISMENVLQAVSGSIQVCRALGIRYFWVDALCIIQGDAEDWSKESFQMSKIYENSYLTLCVVQGDSCSSGFLKKDYTPPNLKINFQSKLNSAISGHLTLRMLLPPSETLRRCTPEDGKYGRADCSPGDTDLQNAAWRTRGWTFQEDQLAPRQVFFGNFMFHVSRGSALEATDGSSIGHFRFMEGIDSLERGLSTWYSMIAGYSARNLTVQQDRFPAISALARSFAERFPDQRYLAGLLESNIHMGLLWTCPAWIEFDKFRDLVSKKYTAPSWSWAHRPLQVSWILSGDEHPTSELVIRETEVISEKHNPYGRVSKGRLLLIAKIFKPPTQKNGRVRLKHSYKYWKYMNVPTFNYMLHSKRKRFMAKILFDWDSYCAINDNGYSRGPMGDISLLLTANILPGDAPMMKSRDLPDDQEMLLGIVVRPSPEEEGAYEKLGLWYTEDREKGGRKFWKMFRCRILYLV